MFDPEKFKADIEELRKKITPPPEAQEAFGDHALREFCVDIADAINGINPFLGVSFKSFYNSIGCVIAGDKIDAVTILSNENCPDLYSYFQELTLPASISLQFFLSFPGIPGWLTLTENVFVYFSEYQFEVHYAFGAQEEIRYPKSYSSHLLRNEVGPLLDAVSKSFYRKIAAKANPNN